VPVVEQDLFLTMGGMAWAFDIRKKRDPATGAELPVHWNEYTPLLIAKPARFPFDAVPRSPDKFARICEMHKAAPDRPGGEDGKMDISQFRPDLGEQIYFDEVAERSDSASLPDLTFSGPGTPGSEELRSNLEGEEEEAEEEEEEEEEAEEEEEEEEEKLEPEPEPELEPELEPEEEEEEEEEPELEEEEELGNTERRGSGVDQQAGWGKDARAGLG
jgi:hypothetical protein